MAANITPIFPITPRIETQQIATADGTDKKLIFAPSTNGSRVNIIGASSTDTAIITLNFYVSKDSGSTFSFLGFLTIAAGFQGVVSSGIPCFDLAVGMAIPSGSDIYVAASAAVTVDY